MREQECLECMSKNTGEYMDPVEKSDGMHYYFLCEDCKYEWEMIKNKSAIKYLNQISKQ